MDAKGVFLLEETTGRLLTHAPLTRYTHGTFSITVAAASELGQEPVYANIKVMVVNISRHEILTMAMSYSPKHGKVIVLNMTRS